MRFRKTSGSPEVFYCPYAFDVGKDRTRQHIDAEGIATGVFAWG